MDIDFPFVLTWAVLICGVIWLFDVLFLKPRRVAELGEGEEDQEPMLVEYAHSFFPVLLFVLVLRSFLAEPYQIPSESMVPTLEVGDFILVNKYAYGIRLPVLGTKVIDVGDPQPGDIMVFVPPHDSRYFIKRVIGVPGDRIRYDNKAVYVNGERLGYELVGEVQRFHERFRQLYSVKEYTETINGVRHATYRRIDVDAGAPQEWTVGEGHYFMMGDNRDLSEDSREWGQASESKIVGKAVAIWLHKEPGFAWPTFERNRWLQSSEME